MVGGVEDGYGYVHLEWDSPGMYAVGMVERVDTPTSETVGIRKKGGHEAG